MTRDETSEPKTIMIIAGGTGGHIYPALAVAATLVERKWRVIWLGAPGGMETALVAKAGFPMHTVDFAGVRGKGFARLLSTPGALSRACWQALGAIRAANPNVVLGMGGYISAPGGLMARLAGKPLVIHEQNSIAGFANRMLAHIARRVLAAFPDVLPRAEHTGNPVRAEIANIASPGERYARRGGRLRVLVVGGSLGAQALNEAIPKALAMLPWNMRPAVLHQSGAKHISELRANYDAASIEGDLVAFIEDMAAAYADADLVICRAGATTIAELSAAGVASVLVPFPHAVDDHQTSNAKFLADQDAAILLPQGEMTPEAIAKLFIDLSRPKLAAMAEKARALGKPDAAVRVADVCEAVAK